MPLLLPLLLSFFLPHCAVSLISSVGALCADLNWSPLVPGPQQQQCRPPWLPGAADFADALEQMGVTLPVAAAAAAGGGSAQQKQHRQKQQKQKQQKQQQQQQQPQREGSSSPPGEFADAGIVPLLRVLRMLCQPAAPAHDGEPVLPLDLGPLVSQRQLCVALAALALDERLAAAGHTRDAVAALAAVLDASAPTDAVRLERQLITALSDGLLLPTHR
jgi:hypothetical protein